MKAKVFSNTQLIGTTELKISDETMGVVYGEFSPTEEYYLHIQKAVWNFWEVSKPTYKKWYSLRLNVQLENGCFLFPHGGYTIDDVRDFANQPKRIDIAGIDRGIIEEFFLSQSPKPFVEEPWNRLTIEQKIAFEDELRKDIGLTGQSFLGFIKMPSSRHILAGGEFSAFCHDQRNDNVLFAIRKEGLDKSFVLVHLTWLSKKEIEGYPRINLYADFDDFKYSRMDIDKADWAD